MNNDQEIKGGPVESKGEPVESKGEPVESKGEPVESKGEPGSTEDSFMIPLLVVVALVAMTAGGFHLYRSGDELRKLVSDTQAQCVVIADELDGSTTEGGTYLKKDNSYEMDEADSWGNAIHVNYSKGGFMEILKVTSAGPDGQRGSKDDIVEVRKSANMSGVGSGIRDNIGETVKNAAEGFKEGMKDKDEDEDEDEDKKDDDG